MFAAITKVVIVGNADSNNYSDQKLGKKAKSARDKYAQSDAYRARVSDLFEASRYTVSHRATGTSPRLARYHGISV